MPTLTHTAKLSANWWLNGWLAGWPTICIKQTTCTSRFWVNFNITSARFRMAFEINNKRERTLATNKRAELIVWII